MTNERTAAPPADQLPANDARSALDGRRHVWTIGDYSAIARRLLPASADIVETLGIGPGARVLDVGAGDGNTAIEAARRGAVVTAVDLTPTQLDKARRRAADTGVKVALYEADAQHLPFPDASFDAVVSAFGMIFAPDHVRAAAELARACRPGGQVAITSWSVAGWFSIWRDRVRDLAPEPPPGSPEPDAWGDPGEVRRRLEAAGLDVRVETRPFSWRFPSVQDALDFLLTKAGPFVALMEATAAAGREDEAVERLRATLIDVNQAEDGTVELDSPYLLAVGLR